MPLAIQAFAQLPIHAAERDLPHRMILCHVMQHSSLHPIREGRADIVIPQRNQVQRGFVIGRIVRSLSIVVFVRAVVVAANILVDDNLLPILVAIAIICLLYTSPSPRD